MTYDIVKYSPDLSGEVARLQTALWSSDFATNLRYASWKYEENPFISSPLVYLALVDGSAVGMRGFMGSQWQIGAERLAVPLACDVVIEATHRNRGVFSLLMDAALEDMAGLGYRYVLSLSAQRITLLSSLASGWRSVGSLDVLHRTTRSRHGARKMLDRLGKAAPWCESIARRILPRSPLVSPFSRLDTTARRKSHPRISLTTAPRAAEMAALVAIRPGGAPIRSVRDESFFEWRFRNPRAAYRFLYWDDTDLRGYLTLAAGLSYEADRLYPTVRILDWEAGNAEIESELLATALAWGRFSSLETWSAGLSEHAGELLEGYGFRPSHKDPSFSDPGAHLLVRPTRSPATEVDWVANGVELLEMGNWELRPAYSDDY